MRSSINLCSSLFLSVFCVLVAAQATPGRVIPQANEPVKILELTSRKKTVDLDHAFANGDDWLEDFKIKLKNVSNNTVVYVEIKFNFTEASAAGNELSFTIELGNKPGAASTNNAPMALKPRQERNYLLNKTEYQALAAFVKERRKRSQLDRVEVKVGSVLFAG